MFPLKPWLMKPFPGRGLDDFQRICNYRLYTSLASFFFKAYAALRINYFLLYLYVEFYPRDVKCQMSESHEYIILNSTLKILPRQIATSRRLPYVLCFVGKKRRGICSERSPWCDVCHKNLKHLAVTFRRNWAWKDLLKLKTKVWECFGNSHFDNRNTVPETIFVWMTVGLLVVNNLCYVKSYVYGLFVLRLECFKSLK